MLDAAAKARHRIALFIIFVHVTVYSSSHALLPKLLLPLAAKLSADERGGAGFARALAVSAATNGTALEQEQLEQEPTLEQESEQMLEQASELALGQELELELEPVLELEPSRSRSRRSPPPSRRARGGRRAGSARPPRGSRSCSASSRC